MSIRTDTVLQTGRVFAPNIHRSAPARILRTLLRNASRLFSSLQAAQSVVRRADYYYSRSNDELRRIGLTRDDVPAALMREYEQYMKQ